MPIRARTENRTAERAAERAAKLASEASRRSALSMIAPLRAVAGGVTVLPARL